MEIESRVVNPIRKAKEPQARQDSLVRGREPTGTGIEISCMRSLPLKNPADRDAEI